MDKIVKAKQGFTIIDMFGVGIAKSLSEKFLANIIGNGTMLSGGIKLAGAYGVQQMVGGKAGQIMGTALAVDGVEDILLKVFTGNISLGGESSEGVLI